MNTNFTGQSCDEKWSNYAKKCGLNFKNLGPNKKKQVVSYKLSYLMQNYAKLRDIMRNYAILCKIMRNYAILCEMTRYYVKLRDIMQNYAIASDFFRNYAIALEKIPENVHVYLIIRFYNRNRTNISIINSIRSLS